MDKDQSKSGEWKEWSRHVLIEIQRLNDSQKEMNQHLNENTASLREHMSQTAGVKQIAIAALKENELLEESLNTFKTQITNEISPIKDHVKIVSSVFKWLLPSGVILALPAAIYYILKIFGKI